MIFFLIEPGFDAEHDGELAAGHNAPDVSGREREFHLVAMRFNGPVKGFDQTAGLLHRRVVGVVSVRRDVFDHEVDAAGAGSSVVELAYRLLLPGIDAFPVDPVGHVDMPIGKDLPVGDRAESKQQNCS